MVRLRRLMLVMPNQEAGISVTLPFVHSTSYVQNVPMRTNGAARNNQHRGGLGVYRSPSEWRDERDRSRRFQRAR
jgi:hypothetical protein